MRIFTEQTLKEFIQKRPDAKVALQDWVAKVKKSAWEGHADVKKTFRSADYVGNQRYVFNIKGNTYRLVAIVRFTIGYAYIRIIGTHDQYGKIDCSNI